MAGSDRGKYLQFPNQFETMAKWTFRAVLAAVRARSVEIYGRSL